MCKLIYQEMIAEFAPQNLSETLDISIWAEPQALQLHICPLCHFTVEVAAFPDFMEVESNAPSLITFFSCYSFSSLSVCAAFKPNRAAYQWRLPQDCGCAWGIDKLPCEFFCLREREREGDLNRVMEEVEEEWFVRWFFAGLLWFNAGVAHDWHLERS